MGTVSNGFLLLLWWTAGKDVVNAIIAISLECAAIRACGKAVVLVVVFATLKEFHAVTNVLCSSTVLAHIVLG